MMRARRPPQGLLPPFRLVLGLLSLLSLLLLPLAAGGASTEARVAFSNEGSVDLEVFWRHPQTKQYSLLATIEKGAGRDINTFQGHEFFLAAAGLGTPPAIVEPNFVQKEAREDRYILKTIEGRGGAFRVDVDVIPAGGHQRRQQSPKGNGTNSGSSSSSSRSVVSGPDGPQAVTLMVKNNAGAPLGVHWLDEGKGQYVKVTAVEDGQEMNVNSFVGHRLLVLPADEERAGMGPASHPPNVQVRGDEVFRVEEDPDDEDEVALVSESFTPPPPPPLETPPKQASTTTAAGGGATDKKKRRPPPAPLKRQQQGAADGAAVPAVPAHEAVTLELVKEVIKRCGAGRPACVADALYRLRVAQIQKQVQTEMTQRDEVEEPYRDFACLNYHTMLPAAHETHTWVYDPLRARHNDGVCSSDGDDHQCPTRNGSNDTRREVRVDHFFDAPGGNARIYLLHDFVAPHECAALKTRAGGRLAAAAVTGDSPGEKIVSKSRKAKAALVRPDLKDPTDPLGHLQRRVFAFVNEYGGGGYEDFGMPGQEPFNVIMYNTTGDEYRVHCDGYCDSSPFMPGGRAATVVVFCEEAARGGQTSFTNADILVKGKAGQAVFFHYRDGDNFMDSGWTRHGGCPVVEGTKWIATQWIRDGVSAEDPWFGYTPTGDRDGPRGMKSSDPNY